MASGPTYPLKTGGSLTSTCPSWCTADHLDGAQGFEDVAAVRAREWCDKHPPMTAP
ncbi:hypothetical protein [Streptomyces sp. NPDC048192]|uniref:hypothetical protein n=1 Tax=Streptomyces sp. NPDC048192 TaxID=3365510 RepID=UPI003722E52E